MKDILIRITLYASLAVLLAACSQVDDPSLPNETLTPPATNLPVKTTQTEHENGGASIAEFRSTPIILREEIVTMPVSGNLERLIDIAKQDLARRLEIAPDEIEVQHIEKAEWPDTSLGCAEPGLSRYPVAIPGYRIILTTKGREFVYHTNRESGVVYCPKG